MEDRSNADPSCKSRQRTITIANDTSGNTNPTASPQNEGVLASIYNKVEKIPEEHPQLYSKAESILEDLYKELEVSAATRK